MSRIGKLLVGLALVAGLAGCTAMTGETAGQNVNDSAITAKIKSKMGADKASTLTSVDVDTVRGTVYLTGTVADSTAKQRATEIAQSVTGVNRVVNNLETRTSAGDVPRAPTGDVPRAPHGSSY